MKKVSAKECWEYWDCSGDMKDKCAVYKNRDGKKCWVYTDNLKVFDWAIPKRTFITCTKCPWYGKNHTAHCRIN